MLPKEVDWRGPTWEDCKPVLEGVLNDGCKALITGSNQIELFGIGNDFAMWTAKWVGSSWALGKFIGQQLTVVCLCICWQKGHKTVTLCKI